MSVRTLFTRALAAAAVVGIAITGTATGAGAADDPPTASLPPVGVTLDLGTGPVVAIGGASTPGAGVNGTAPTDGHATVTVPAGPGAGLAGAAVAGADAATAVNGPSGQRVDSDVALDVCVAVAILTGQSTEGCGLPAGSAAPSLGDALARVGLCARAELATSGGVAACGGGAAAAGAVPGSLAGLDSDAQACIAAAVLGFVDPSRCATGADGAGDATSDGSIAASGGRSTSAVSRADACFGLAVLTGADTAGCAVTGAAFGTNPRLAGSGSAVAAGGAAGASPSAVDAIGDSIGSALDHALAFGGGNGTLGGLVGLGSIATGLALRWGARVRHA